MIKTTIHRSSNAVRFKNVESDRLWMVIGGTAAWSNETAPPSPVMGADAVNTPVGAKKCVLRWVVRDPAGTIQIVGPSGSEYWREVMTEADVYAEGCRWVMVQAEIVGDELPTTTFREIGLFQQLTPAAGHEADEALLPANVDDYGKLQALEYRQAVNRDSNSSYKVINIFEF